MTKAADIEVFPTGPIATNAYVLSCRETQEATIIDPGLESSSMIFPYLEEHALTPVSILLTHTHWDHIADIPILKKRYNIPVYVHSEDAPNLEQPGYDGLPQVFPLEAVFPDYMLSEEKSLTVGSIRIEVIHTPGHSPGGVAFYLPEENVLFSGDTLFKGSIGNLTFPTADPERMWVSLDKLAKLPLETLVYPGHGEPTTIGEEDWLPRARHIFGGGK